MAYFGAVPGLKLLAYSLADPGLAIVLFPILVSDPVPPPLYWCWDLGFTLDVLWAFHARL